MKLNSKVESKRDKIMRANSDLKDLKEMRWKLEIKKKSKYFLFSSIDDKRSFQMEGKNAKTKKD